MRRGFPPKGRPPVTRSMSSTCAEPMEVESKAESKAESKPKAEASASKRRVGFHTAGASGRVLCMIREFEIDEEGGCYMNRAKSREMYTKRMTKKVPGPVPGSYEPKLCRSAEENDARFANVEDANDVSQIEKCLKPEVLEWARHAHNLACRFEKHPCADSVRLLLGRMELSRNAWCRGQWEETVRDALVEDRLESNRPNGAPKRKFVVT